MGNALRRIDKGGAPTPSFAVVDSQGQLLCVRVVRAGCHNGTVVAAGAQKDATALRCGAPLWRQAFGGRFKKAVEATEGVEVITAQEQIGVTKDGRKLHKKRWVVERTTAWELCSRRLARDFERKPEHAEAFCYISSISRSLKNLN